MFLFDHFDVMNRGEQHVGDAVFENNAVRGYDTSNRKLICPLAGWRRGRVVFFERNMFVSHVLLVHSNNGLAFLILCIIYSTTLTTGAGGRGYRKFILIMFIVFNLFALAQSQFRPILCRGQQVP